jgi:hypothetical protein
MLCSVFSSILEIVLSSNRIHNLWLFHIYSLADTALFSIIFYLWRKNERSGKIIKGAFILFFIVWLIDGVFFDAFHKGIGISANAENIFEVIFSVIMLANVLLDERSRQLKQDPRFWAASGFLLYAGGTFFLFSFFQDFLQIPMERSLIVWHINWVLSLITFVFFACALYCKPEQPA